MTNTSAAAIVRQVYGPSAWWWEVEELVRKLLLSAVVVLIESGSPLQVCFVTRPVPRPLTHLETHMRTYPRTHLHTTQCPAFSSGSLVQYNADAVPGLYR